MEMNYLWYVKVYQLDKYQWNEEQLCDGVWEHEPSYDRTFRNKLNALDYAASFRRRRGWHANVFKWYGD